MVATFYKRAVVGMRRSGAVWRIALLALLGLILFFVAQWARPDPALATSQSNLVVFLLVNLNIIVLCVLAFLVGRNVVKLIFDRRRNILGSKLRMRLTVAFVGLAMVPTMLLFFMAYGFLNNALDGWFSSHVEQAVSGSVEVARLHHRMLVEDAKRVTARVVSDVEAQKSPHTTDSWTQFLERRRERMGFFSIRLFKNEQLIAEATNVAASIESFREPDPNQDALRKAAAGEFISRTEREGANQFIRTYAPVSINQARAVLMISSKVDPELVQAIESVSASFKEYEQLKLFKNPLRTSYFLAMFMVTGLVLFGAIWIGFYIARDISGPIQLIAEGTTEVARGNYDFQIKAVGSDELGFLARSFNQMTRDLHSSRSVAERRRLLIETILENLAVGVMALDQNEVITSVNMAAGRLFEIKDIETVVGKSLGSTLDATLYEQIAPLITQVKNAPHDMERARELELSLRSEGTERRVVCTAGSITGESSMLGVVLLFDDITDLSKAQQVSAWREVARRVAHEIKNPLTPIQLSAQRLEKLAPQLESGAVVQECAQTIVQHVDSIKRLTNEFSNFARMPTAEFVEGDLNNLIADLVAGFAANHADAVFQFIPDSTLPPVSFDREQVRRVLINLIDNAIASCRESKLKTSDSARIVLKTNFERKRRKVVIEIADNGLGIPDQEKGRIFDPYFTTKKGGSGLGLAIVSTIVSEHQGGVRVYDNQPRGTKFIVELALDPQHVVQRRFAVGSEQA